MARWVIVIAIIQNLYLSVWCCSLQYASLLSSSEIGSFLYSDTSKSASYAVLVVKDKFTMEEELVCIRYYDQNILLQSSPERFYPIFDATQYEACRREDTPDEKLTKGHLLIVLGKPTKCPTKTSVSRKRYYKKKEPEGVIFINNNEMPSRFRSSDLSTFIDGHITEEEANKLLEKKKNIVVAPYTEVVGVDDTNYWVHMTLDILAIIVVGVGAIWSGLVRNRKLMEESDDIQYPYLNAYDEQDMYGSSVVSRGVMKSSIDFSIKMTAVVILIITALGVTIMVTKLFAPKVVYMFWALIYFLLSIVAIYICFRPLFKLLPRRMATNTVGMRRSISLFSVLLGFISLLIPILYYAFHHFLHSWIVMDILTCLIVIMIVRTVRPSNLMFIASLMICFFLVYLLDFIVKDSEPLQEEQGSTNIPPMGIGVNLQHRIPNRLYFPQNITKTVVVCNVQPPFTDESILIMIIPGILIAFCFAFDLKYQVASYLYSILSYIGYILGMLISKTVEFVIQIKQYKMLYIIPIMLIPVIITSLIKKQFYDMWKDSHKIKKTKYGWQKQNSPKIYM